MKNKLEFLKNCIDSGARFFTHEVSHDICNIVLPINAIISQIPLKIDNTIKLHEFFINNDMQNCKLCFQRKWDRNGESGGNCWGDEPEEFENYDPPDDCYEFERFMKSEYPQYDSKEILSSMPYETYYETEYECYGNYTNYEIHVFYVDKLYDLLENKLNPKKLFQP